MREPSMLSAEFLKGLPAPLRPGEPIPDLHRLTTVRDGVHLKLACTCGGQNWLKVRSHFQCYACKNLTVESDGAQGWRVVETTLPPVLDACCGSRMFWFDKQDGRALFLDKRREVCDVGAGRKHVVVDPDVLGNFAALPFDDDSFNLVVFDPPHTFNGPDGFMGKKYGTLLPGWREEIAAGFAECFRVLKPAGTLVFKWNEHRVPVASILALTPEKPLFGHRSGVASKTH